jgi:hypothetical protein
MLTWIQFNNWGSCYRYIIVGSKKLALTTVRLEMLSPMRSTVVTFLTNDNEGALPAPSFENPDAHGQAALLLVESLIHSLIARSVIGLEDAIDVLTVALDVRMEMATDHGEGDDTTDKSLTLLSAIRDSLTRDVA